MKYEHELIKDISDVIGIENTRKFIERFSGEQLYIPDIKRVSMPERNARIISDYNKGYSVNELKSIYRLSERQIRNILGGYREKRK